MFPVPAATRALIIANVAVFLGQMVADNLLVVTNSVFSPKFS